MAGRKPMAAETAGQMAWQMDVLKALSLGDKTAAKMADQLVEMKVMATMTAEKLEQS